MLVEATRVAADRDAAVKPPRLNFARICLYCGERDCEASRCIEFYERSRWMVCPDCDGQEWSELLEPCGCMFGVVEAAPDSDRRGVE